MELDVDCDGNVRRTTAEDSLALVASKPYFDATNQYRVFLLDRGNVLTMIAPIKSMASISCSTCDLGPMVDRPQTRRFAELYAQPVDTSRR